MLIPRGKLLASISHILFFIDFSVISAKRKPPWTAPDSGYPNEISEQQRNKEKTTLLFQTSLQELLPLQIQSSEKAKLQTIEKSGTFLSWAQSSISPLLPNKNNNLLSAKKISFQKKIFSFWIYRHPRRSKLSRKLNKKSVPSSNRKFFEKVYSLTSFKKRTLLSVNKVEKQTTNKESKDKGTMTKQIPNIKQKTKPAEANTSEALNDNASSNSTSVTTDPVKSYNDYVYRRRAIQRSEDAVWGLACTIFILVLLVWAVWFSGLCKSTNETYVHAEYSTAIQRMSVKEMLKSRAKYLPIFKFRNKKKKDDEIPLIDNVTASDEDDDDTMYDQSWETINVDSTL